MHFNFINPFSDEFLQKESTKDFLKRICKETAEEHKTEEDALVIPSVKYRNSH